VPRRGGEGYIDSEIESEKASERERERGCRPHEKKRVFLKKDVNRKTPRNCMS